MSYNYCAIQQNGVVVASSKSRNRTSMVCPQPRRVAATWQLGHQVEVSEARAGSELLDIILSKGSEKPNTQVASSPPFFSGSPPSRVSNPLIKDARFRAEKQLIPPFLPLTSSPVPTSPGSSPSPNSSLRNGGCIRANFGNYPAIRVEGFDCLDRDRRRNCSIPGLA
ncbi:hypothetical protein vseg_008982 [Gypsophila vaccaria]